MDKMPQVAKDVVQYLSNAQLTVRLIGGLGVYYKCPHLFEMGFGRKYQDIDLVGLSKESTKIKKALAGFGFMPDQRFNAVHGERRLLFHLPDEDGIIDLDIFLDIFEMCHVILLKDRLHVDTLTLSVSDLLLTKLQVVKFTQKDAGDVLALFAHHEISDADDAINAHYVGQLVSADWGLYTTIMDNLRKIPNFLGDFPVSQENSDKILQRIKLLVDRLESHPKSLKWKIRDTIGRRIPWYDLPDEKKLE